MSGFASSDPSLQYKQAYIQDEFIMTCSNCGRKLLNIIITEKKDVATDIIVTCPCGDRSFLKTVKGLFRYAPPDDLAIVDITYGEFILFLMIER